jgi:SAM-dependent methyltransferase
LGEPVIDVKARLPVVIDRLSEAEIDEYGVLRPGIDPTEIRRRISAGHRCFVARHKGRLIHANWVTAGRAWIDYLSCDLQLARDEAYSYENFTIPEFRGQNISAVCLASMLREFQIAGYRRLLMGIVPENKTAFRPPAKTGFRSIGKMGYIQIGPWRHLFCRMHSGLQSLVGPSESLLSGYWDSVARNMNERPHYLDSFLGEMKRQAHLSLLQQWGGVPGGGRLLKTDLFEEAMGPDSFLGDIVETGTAVGMDISGVIVVQAKQRCPGSPVFYVAADVRHLPFINGAFSLAISPSTLDHFADRADLDQSLNELRRILEPGGRLIITIDNRQNIFNPLLKLANRMKWLPYFVGHPLTIKELRHALTSAGFEVLDTTAIMHNPRLVAVGMMMMAKKFDWKPLIRFFEKTLFISQKLENSSLRYWTGSFIAAHAVRSS